MNLEISGLQPVALRLLHNYNSQHAQPAYPKVRLSLYYISQKGPLDIFEVIGK